MSTLVLELGGTKYKWAIVPDASELKDSDVKSFEHGVLSGPEKLAHWINHAASQARSQGHVINKIGVSVAGNGYQGQSDPRFIPFSKPIPANGTTIIASKSIFGGGTYTGPFEIPIKEFVAQAAGVSVENTTVFNDGVCAAIAEFKTGANRGVPNSAIV